MNKALLKHLVELVNDVPLTGGIKSLAQVEDNVYTGRSYNEVPQIKELEKLDRLKFIGIVPSSGTLFDIQIGEKAINYFK